MKNPDKVTLLLANPRIAEMLGIEVDEIKLSYFHNFEFKRNGQKYKITLHSGTRKKEDKDVSYQEIEISRADQNYMLMYPKTVIRNDIKTWDDITKLLEMFSELTK